MRTPSVLIFSVILAVFGSSSVLAHPGLHSGNGLVDGMMHPLIGMDHLLVALAVGLCAAQADRGRHWLLPITFVTAMAAGVALAFAGAVVLFVEPLIIASLATFGCALAGKLRLTQTVGLVLCAGFAVIHGAAHGHEIAAGLSPLGYAAGLLLTTGLVHGLGVILGAWLITSAPLVLRLAGLGIAGFAVASTFAA
jgi:urease accessory protein